VQGRSQPLIYVDLPPSSGHLDYFIYIATQVLIDREKIKCTHHIFSSVHRGIRTPVFQFDTTRLILPPYEVDLDCWSMWTCLLLVTIRVTSFTGTRPPMHYRCILWQHTNWTRNQNCPHALSASTRGFEPPAPRPYLMGRVDLDRAHLCGLMCSHKVCQLIPFFPLTIEGELVSVCCKFWENSRKWMMIPCVASFRDRGTICVDLRCSWALRCFAPSLVHFFASAELKFFSMTHDTHLESEPVRTIE
jgi:hypothetical protein